MENTENPESPTPVESTEPPEIIAQRAVISRPDFLRQISAWLETNAPGECAALEYYGVWPEEAPGAAEIELPTYWVFDVSELKHRPLEQPEEVFDTLEKFKRLRYDRDWIVIKVLRVLGPIPPCPV